jgi:hypothetical protein
MIVNGSALAIAGMTASAIDVHKIAGKQVFNLMTCSVEG